MALTYSPNANLGAALPKFSLTSVEGRTVTSDDFEGPLLIMFICNHCPYVNAIEDRILQLAQVYSSRVRFVAICANDASDHPEDRPEALLKRAQDKKYPFPYLIDEAQSVAKAIGAVCTPDFFLYDARAKLAYRGRLDDSWRNPAQVRKAELRLALDAVLANQQPAALQNSSMGCSIKWK